MKSVAGVLVFLTWALSPHVDKPLKSVSHGQCDDRPTVTFPVAKHRCPATGTELYCFVTEAQPCEQLAQGCYLTAARPGVELATFRVPISQRLNHCTTRPHVVGLRPDKIQKSSNFRFVSPAGRADALISVKFGVAEPTISLWKLQNLQTAGE